MQAHLLDVLVCPLCKGKLQHNAPANQLICQVDQLAFPIRDGIPIMLENEATAVSSVS